MAEQQFSAPPRTQHGLRGVVHIRHRHTERFTVVGNHLAQHDDLSLTAIGLAVHIQSRPDGALVTIKALVARFPEGEVVIARALRELEAAGYLARVRERLPDGRRVTRTYAYDCPEHRVQPAAAPPSTSPAPPVPESGAHRPEPVFRPLPGPVREPDCGEAVDLLASLRGQDPRLLLSRRDIARLAPSAAVWLERGVTPETATRTLTADLPGDPIRSAYAVVSYRLTHWLPPALPVQRTDPDVPGPYPMQNCEKCDHAFRAPEPGECRDCAPARYEPTDPQPVSEVA